MTGETRAQQLQRTLGEIARLRVPPAVRLAELEGAMNAARHFEPLVASAPEVVRAFEQYAASLQQSVNAARGGTSGLSQVSSPPKNRGGVPKPPPANCGTGS